MFRFWFAIVSPQYGALLNVFKKSCRTPIFKSLLSSTNTFADAGPDADPDPYANIDTYSDRALGASKSNNAEPAVDLDAESDTVPDADPDAVVDADPTMMDQQWI